MSSTKSLRYAMQYAFHPPEKLIKNEESLVMPTLNMIGNIGGTVGIFIEFDFVSAILQVTSLAKVVLLRMKGKYSQYISMGQKSLNSSY